MNIWGKVLHLFGWNVEITAPRRNKCVICVAPHTSNYDFLLGLAAYRSLGRKANFLMKKFWFFFPLSIILKHFGGIPVRRNKHNGSLTEAIITDFKHTDYMNLAVTPEGTRSATKQWRTGFLYIAYGAGVPIQLGIIDYKNKSIIIKDEYHPTGNIDIDMDYIKNYYIETGELACYPEKFII
ncbi:MAG: 1-acyl-sn-glycerol-3-phosphate acyltransferase [Muribaculaceae bacterium]|nr:1-acyl-sn-glycerol-3-phosphate acyltransferase [Muribaculaceae bacterium]